MGFIKHESLKIGDKVKLKTSHTSLTGTFEAGTIVTIIYIANHGYSVMDDEGNKMHEIGFDIGEKIENEPETKPELTTDGYQLTENDVSEIKGYCLMELFDFIRNINNKLEMDTPMQPLSYAESSKLIALKTFADSQLTLRKQTAKNRTGIYDCVGVELLPGHRLRKENQPDIIIDEFGTYFPGCFSYHTDTKITNHKPLTDLLNSAPIKYINYSIVQLMNYRVIKNATIIVKNSERFN